MAKPIRLHHYAFAEYLAIEEVARVKHEYLDGEIYAMAGGTPEHATLGDVPQVGFPARFSRTPVEFQRFGPLPGEHTREVLREAGYRDTEIDALEHSMVVGAAALDGERQRGAEPGEP